MSFFATRWFAAVLCLLLQVSAQAASPAAKPLSPTAKAGLREVIYYSTRVRGKLQLSRMNGDGTGKVFLSHERDTFLPFIANGSANEWSPALSPDGKWVAYYSDRSGAANLWLMNADGSGQESVTDEDVDIASLDTSVHGRILFSPDSATLAFLRGGDIWLYDMKSHLLSSLTKDHGVASLAWSPDGKSIAFVRNKSLYVTRIGSPIVLMLLSNAITWPTLQFEPKNGKQILFFQQGAWTVERETRTFKRLLSSLAVPNRVAYSPQGASVVVLSYSPEHAAEVFLVEKDAKPSQLTRGGAQDCFFSSDGSHVYFVRNHKLWIIGADSKGSRPVSHTPVYGPMLGLTALPLEAK